MTAVTLQFKNFVLWSNLSSSLSPLSHLYTYIADAYIFSPPYTLLWHRIGLLTELTKIFNLQHKNHNDKFSDIVRYVVITSVM